MNHGSIIRWTDMIIARSYGYGFGDVVKDTSERSFLETGSTRTEASAVVMAIIFASCGWST